jgi:hypothetical protein
MKFTYECTEKEFVSVVGSVRLGVRDVKLEPTALTTREGRVISPKSA